MINQIRIGNGSSEVILGHSKLVLMAGPCVIESRDMCMRIAEQAKAICDKLGVGYVFKASFDKANRTSVDSFRGPGIEEGLRILQDVAAEFRVPLLTDIHESWQAKLCGEVVDIIQIPAFLCRQTDLLVAAANTGKVVQVKKAQFLAPWDMKNVIGKLNASDCRKITLVERGSSFGYNRLICDMTSIPSMRGLGYPVIMDATHSTQQPGGLGDASGGAPEMAGVLAKSAIAAGADGLFIETHPNPAEALSDAACMLPLSQLEQTIKVCKEIFEIIRA